MPSNFSFGSTDTPVTTTILEALTVTAQVAVLSPSLVVTVIFAAPPLIAVTLPDSSTFATASLSEVQVTFLFVASSGVIVAFIISSSPMPSNFSFGSTDTPVTTTILEALTVTAQVAVLSPSLVVTVILAVPAATAVTLPSSTVATLELSDIHLTLLSAASVGVTVAVRVNSSPILIALVVSLSVTPVTFFTASVGLQDDKAINIAAIVSSPKLKTFFIIYFLYFYFFNKSLSLS